MTPTGAEASSLIVVTDMDGGCATAPFARYALIQAGYANVRLLDGGTPAWAAANMDGLTSVGSRYLDGLAPDHTTVAPTTSLIFVAHEAVEQALDMSSTAQLVDCRAFTTNAGVLPPDYEGIAIPCLVRISSSDVVVEAGAGQRFKSASDLDALALQAGLVRSRPVITTCYFGVGAAVVATALEIAGWGGLRVHGGSLVEYAIRNGHVCPPPS
jgi:thiosulfate/3-mercaptopyruvate sulfurtransferase